MDKTLYSDLTTLVRVQSSMVVLQTLLDKKDDAADQSADVWNSMLDLRELLIDKIIKNPTFQSGGLLECIVRRASSTNY